jgi:hypothetical protein
MAGEVARLPLAGCSLVGRRDTIAGRVGLPSSSLQANDEVPPDLLLIFGRRHLEQVLIEFVTHCNRARPHPRP